MFKKLRIKFIAITMVMVAVVMALAFSVVCFIEYQRSYSDVETAMNNAVAHGSGGGKSFKGGEGPRFADGSESASRNAWQQDTGGEGFMTPEGTSSYASQNGAESDVEDIAPPMIGRRQGEPRDIDSLVPVVVYELGSDGSATVVPQVTSASISSEVLEEALERVRDVEEGSGTLADIGLHYLKSNHDQSTYIAFADTSYTDSWKSLAVRLLVVGLVTLAVFFVISLFYSRWALRPVREAWDSQRQFVADASHDLKTPLTVILANAAILLKHPERSIASESQWIESTQIEAQNMQGLVNEMLELAQIEAGESVEVEKVDLDLSDLVDGETLLFDSVALERNCGFDCEVEGGLHVLANEKQVKKMVSTLVENAFKYVNDGGSVSVTLRRSGKFAQLAINNSGSVIAPDDLPHIFDRFYRTDKARTLGAGGFGLGLAIAREVALQHGGDITCTSDAEAGTTFIATLPLV